MSLSSDRSTSSHRVAGAARPCARGAADRAAITESLTADAHDALAPSTAQRLAHVLDRTVLRLAKLSDAAHARADELADHGDRYGHSDRRLDAWIDALIADIRLCQTTDAATRTWLAVA